LNQESIRTHPDDAMNYQDTVVETTQDHIPAGDFPLVDRFEINPVAI
jgi:hypothetical protein